MIVRLVGNREKIAYRVVEERWFGQFAIGELIRTGSFEFEENGLQVFFLKES